MSIGISLGWNCCAATTLVEKGLRKRKCDGYKTCVFDQMISNYYGIVECIGDDFKYFCDLNYLSVKKMSDGSLTFSTIPGTGDNIIYNSYYNFAFNHESPGHGNLYLLQNWPNGINHFVDDNFQKFIERYQQRIKNFINYLNSGNHIIFWLNGANGLNLNSLKNVLKKKYPNLSYEIKTSDEDNDRLYNHFKALNFDNDDKEIMRLITLQKKFNIYTYPEQNIFIEFE